MNDNDAPGTAQETRKTCGAGDDTHIVITVTDAAFVAGVFLAAIALTALVMAFLGTL